MTEEIPLKREDSFEVIEGEEHPPTPEESGGSNTELVDENQESCSFFIEDSNVQETVTQAATEQIPIADCREHVASSGEASSICPNEIHSSPAEAITTTTTTLGPAHPFEFHQSVTSGSPRLHSRAKSRHAKQLIPRDCRLRSTRVLEVENRVAVERRWLFPVIFVLSGIILAQFFANRGDSAKIAQLQNELATLKVNYAEGLLKESKGRASVDSEFQKHMAEWELERVHLLEQIRMDSELHKTKEQESQRLIVDLQAERKKLMDSLVRIERQLQQKEEIIGHVKEENARLEAALKRLNEDRSGCPRHAPTKDPGGKSYPEKKRKRVELDFF